MDIQKTRQFLRLLVNRTLLSVSPRVLIKNVLKVNELESSLCVNNRKYELNKNVFVVGFGKAVYEMGYEVESILKNHVLEGVLSVPEGTLESKLKFRQGSSIKVYEGAANNMPDKASHEAAMRIVELIKCLNKENLLIVLISGGGSALLPYPVPPVTLDEKIAVTKLLANSGADIVELNSVRKRLSKVKGGLLASLAYPAKVLGLILSDIINDPIDFIACGPTAFNSDPPGRGFEILEKYSLVEKAPQSVVTSLRGKVETPDLERFKTVENVIVGNNKMALECAKVVCEEYGFKSVVLTSCLSGDVSDVARSYVSLVGLAIRALRKEIDGTDLRKECEKLKEELCMSDEGVEALAVCLEEGSPKVCLILGGETTVRVKGQGKGGRNQELALRFLSGFNESVDSACLLAVATDGIDGPTQAAGAISYPLQLKQAQLQKLSIQEYIEQNDSNTFYSKLNDGEDLLVTGHSGTNVMDIHVLVIQLNS